MSANANKASRKGGAHHPSNPKESRKAADLSFGAVIRADRKRLGWTQKVLADKSNYDEKTIQNVENGRTHKPATIRDLHDVLKKAFKEKGENPLPLPWPQLAFTSAETMGELIRFPTTVKAAPSPSTEDIRRAVGKIIEECGKPTAEVDEERNFDDLRIIAGGVARFGPWPEFRRFATQRLTSLVGRHAEYWHRQWSEVSCQLGARQLGTVIADSTALQRGYRDAHDQGGSLDMRILMANAKLHFEDRPGALSTEVADIKHTIQANDIQRRYMAGKLEGRIQGLSDSRINELLVVARDTGDEGLVFDATYEQIGHLIDCRQLDAAKNRLDQAQTEFVGLIQGCNFPREKILLRRIELHLALRDCDEAAAIAQKDYIPLVEGHQNLYHRRRLGELERRHQCILMPRHWGRDARYAVTSTVSWILSKRMFTATGEPLNLVGPCLKVEIPLPQRDNCGKPFRAEDWLWLESELRKLGDGLRESPERGAFHTWPCHKSGNVFVCYVPMSRSNEMQRLIDQAAARFRQEKVLAFLSAGSVFESQRREGTK